MTPHPHWWHLSMPLSILTHIFTPPGSVERGVINVGGMGSVWVPSMSPYPHWWPPLHTDPTPPTDDSTVMIPLSALTPPTLMTSLSHILTPPTPILMTCGQTAEEECGKIAVECRCVNIVTFWCVWRVLGEVQVRIRLWLGYHQICMTACI